MMSLDVVLTLQDRLSKPSRDATGSLDKLGVAATRLATRLAAPTRAVRGLATALQGLKATDTAAGAATASTGKLRGAMASLAPVSRTAATGLSTATRALDRLSTAADKAEKATGRLHAALGASLPAGGFVAGAETQLRSMLALQRQAVANMARLNAGGGGRGGRSGMGNGGSGGNGGAGNGAGGSHAGIALAYDAPGLMSFSRKAIADTEDAENALTQVRLTGMAPKDVDRIKALAQRVAAENPLTTYAENLRGILEARTALSGDLNEAMALFPKATQYAAIFAHSGGVSGDQVKAAKDAIYQALRAGELRNVANDPKRMDSLLSGIMGASIASDGRITPKSWASNIQYARSAGLGLSDNFTNFALPFLMQELTNGGRGAHGGQAGNALMSAYSTIVQGRIAKASLPEWEAAGQLDKKDVDDKGHVRPGAIKGTAKFMNDPRAFVADIMANFEQRGIKSQTAILEHLSAMFGNRTAAGLMDLMALQDSRLSGFMDMTKMAGAGDPRAAGAKFDMIRNELSTATAGLSHSFGLLRTTAVAPFIPALTSATRDLTSMTAAAQGFLSKMLGSASDPNDPNRHALGFGEIATLAGGAAWLGAKLVTKAPGAATLLGQAAVASQAGPVAGFLSRATVSATVASISGALTSGIGLGLTRMLGKGVLGGLIYEAGTFAIGKLLDALPKPHFTDDQKKYAAADRKEMDGAWPWQVPGLLWRDLTHDRASDRLRREDGEARRPAPADVRGMMKGPQLDLPPIVVPFGGARALGGPVRGGMAYLVGEHGPEILQTGTTGSVATASRTARMLGQMGEAGASEDHDTANTRAIRALGFEITGGLSDVARAIDRLGRGRIATGSGDGSNAAGGGGGFGGRRGFMAREAADSGKGAGVALPDGSTGPRVGLGRMGTIGRGSRGFAKFDAKAPAIMGALMTKYGLTKEQAAGVVGNLGHESGHFTAYHEGGKPAGQGGVGWAQWTGTRRRAFERWTAAHRLDPTSDDASWRFLTEGDPETARAIAAVKQTHTAHDAVRAFHDSFERSADISHGRIVKAGNWNSRLSMADRAYGMSPVDGVKAPDAVASPGAPAMPEVLADRARRKAETDRAAAEDRTRAKAGGGRHAGMNVGVVHVHVAAQPHHDERQVAEMVHKRFNDAVHAQLNDGAFG